MQLRLRPALAGLSAVVAFGGCAEPPLRLEQVYRYQSPYADSGYPQGLTVRTASGGMRIECSGIVLTLGGAGVLAAEPDTVRYSYQVRQLQFDRISGALWTFTTLSYGDRCVLPARIEVAAGPARIRQFYPDAPGAESIAVDIDSSVGYTLFAGLRFRRPATVSISVNGVVHLGSVGETVEDSAGHRWTSRMTRVAGDTARAIVLVSAQR